MALHKYIASFILILCVLPTSVYGQRTKSSISAGQQRNAEKGLKDNRYFFFFINNTVTNLGSDAEKRMFREAVQRDIIAQLLYMRFLFSDSFHEIRKSQALLIDVYHGVLARNIFETKKLLHSFAQSVIRSENYGARHYLELGYRETSSANIHMIMADNYRETLYSMRLYEYVAAIKKSIQGKRYAFLSILEASYPYQNISTFEYKAYKEMNSIVKERVAAAVGNSVEYEEGKAMIAKILRIEELEKRRAFWLRRKRKAEAEKLAKEIDALAKETKDKDAEFSAKYKEYSGKKKYYTLQHADAYYKCMSEKSLFDQIWDDPELDDIKEFREYLKKQ